MIAVDASCLVDPAGGRKAAEVSKLKREEVIAKLRLQSQNEVTGKIDIPNSVYCLYFLSFINGGLAGHAI